MSAAAREERWLRRNRTYLIAAAVAAAGGYGAYKLYNSRSLSDTQTALSSAAKALARFSGAASASSEMLAILSADLRDFLASETDEVPKSLRQLAKLAQCEEVQECLRTCVASSVAGATAPAPQRPGEQAEPGVVDKIIAAFLSDRGRSLVGLAVSVATRDSTSVFCEQLRSAVEAALGSAHLGGSGDRDGIGGMATAALSGLLSLLSSEEGENLLRVLVCSSVSTAVAAYMDGAQQYDMLSPVLDTLSQPEHARAITDMMSGVAAAATREMVSSYFVASSEWQQRSQQQQRRQAPATVVVEGEQQQGQQQQQQQRQWKQAPNAAAALKPSHPAPSPAGDASSSSSASSSNAGDASQPSTPQSWPSTPEPACAAARHADATAATATAANGTAAAGRTLGMLASTSGLLQRRLAPQQNAAAAATAGAGASGSQPSSMAASSSDTIGWSTVVKLMAQAAQVKELRSLAVDVSCSTTREFMRGVLHPGALLQGPGGQQLTEGAAAALTAHMRRLYVLVSVLVFLFVYAMSPRLIGASTA